MGLRKADIDSIDSFHRQLLRKTCNIKYPNKIHCNKLYKVTKSKPASIRIAEARWRYFGHALRLPRDTPPQQSMDFYFADLNRPKFRGAKRTTIVTTLQSDIKKTKEKFPQFQVDSLKSFRDLTNIRQLASDRKLWKKIYKAVIDTVEAEHRDSL